VSKLASLRDGFKIGLFCVSDGLRLAQRQSKAKKNEQLERTEKKQIEKHLQGERTLQHTDLEQQF